ncbi:two pore domain potassium channel family protein [Streptomyces sp. WAC08452]|nr:two pore domain potassium channel family protein [Streptomyces sp. WAC08452]RSS65048.1 two pore domain potassium channel family protein [Streptomyces sp. WAC06273]GGZ46174.1 membrane protein [Streptomyces plicatus]
MRGRRTGRPAARPRGMRGGWPAVRSRVVRGGWPAVRPWVVRAGAAAGVVVAYFLLPLDHLGPQRPVLSQLLFALILTVVAVLLLRQIRHVLVDRPDSRPGMVLSLLIVLSVHVFSATYYALAKQPGEFTGLHTRVDALYFTVVTLATVGYGDITPRGQSARIITVLQIAYSFVFLTAAATALTQRMRDMVVRRTDRDRDRDRAG